jgi:short-subunit dehydrogenase
MNIFVTGASRGIGYELTKRFCSMKGHHIIALAREIDPLKQLADRIEVSRQGSFLYPYAVDLSKNGFEKALPGYVNDRFKKIDILVNNAGTLINKPFSQNTADDFDQLFNVNVKSPFLLIKTLLPYFASPSHIVNIGSMGGFQGSDKFPGLSLYSASKGALAIFSECLAEELKEMRISVNCLALGSVQTEMLKNAFPNYDAPVKPAQIAEFIADFAINGWKYMNGKIIPVALKTP